MLLSASMNATAVFLLVPVASANSVASCVFDNFFPFAISSNVLFLNLISVSVYTCFETSRAARAGAFVAAARSPVQKRKPLLWPPLTRASTTGDFLRREDYYTAKKVATEKYDKQIG